MRQNDEEKRESLRRIILPAATKAFHELGIRAVKMDDIAAMLKMSKRTLYEVYDNKMDLLWDVMEASVMRKQKHMEQYKVDCDDVMDLLIEFFRIHMEDYACISSKFIEDLRRYPEMVEKMHHLHDKSNSSMEFFAVGIEQGVFRENVNYEFLSKVAFDMGRILREDPTYMEFSYSDIFTTFVCTMLRGICTEKGLYRFDSFMERTMQNRKRGM